MHASTNEIGTSTGSQYVTAIDSLSNVVGLYMLTADGTLGVYDEDKRFVVDQRLTTALAPQIRQLLASGLADASGGDYRCGLIYHSIEPRPWNSDTLALEESVLREVYPVSGPSNQELTAFQKKNREKSIYRGIELLLEYRYERIRDEPVYCPVLFDRGSTLGEYPNYGLSSTRSVPVMEVWNLMAHIPLGRRGSSELEAVRNNTHRFLVHKDMRAGVFTLNEKQFNAATPEKHSAVDFFDADKRHERAQTFPTGGALHQRLVDAEQAQTAERFAQVEQWLERPHRPVDPALLRTFTQFRNVDGNVLSVFAEKALVHTAPSSARLLNIGMSDKWNMYLMEGTVSLQAEDGQTLFVTGGTDKAGSPISFLKPRKYTVTAVTSVSFLWVHDALLAAVLPAAAPAEKPVAPALKPFRS